MALSEEQLQAIRERAEYAYSVHMDVSPDNRWDRIYPDVGHDYFCDVDALLAEVDRLRAIEVDLQQELALTAESLSAAYDELVERTRQIAAMREIVEAVAKGDALALNGIGEQVAVIVPPQRIAKARALLAQEAD